MSFEAYGFSSSHEPYFFYSRPSTPPRTVVPVVPLPTPAATPRHSLEESRAGTHHAFNVASTPAPSQFTPLEPPAVQSKPATLPLPLTPEPSLQSLPFDPIPELPGVSAPSLPPPPNLPELISILKNPSPKTYLWYVTTYANFSKLYKLLNELGRTGSRISYLSWRDIVMISFPSSVHENVIEITKTLMEQSNPELISMVNGPFRWGRSSLLKFFRSNGDKYSAHEPDDCLFFKPKHKYQPRYPRFVQEVIVKASVPLTTEKIATLLMAPGYFENEKDGSVNQDQSDDEDEQEQDNGNDDEDEDEQDDDKDEQGVYDKKRDEDNEERDEDDEQSDNDEQDDDDELDVEFEETDETGVKVALMIRVRYTKLPEAKLQELWLEKWTKKPLIPGRRPSDRQPPAHYMGPWPVNKKQCREGYFWYENGKIVHEAGPVASFQLVTKSIVDKEQLKHTCTITVGDLGLEDYGFSSAQRSRLETLNPGKPLKVLNAEMFDKDLIVLEFSLRGVYREVIGSLKSMRHLADKEALRKKPKRIRVSARPNEATSSEGWGNDWQEVRTSRGDSNREAQRKKPGASM